MESTAAAVTSCSAYQNGTKRSSSFSSSGRSLDGAEPLHISTLNDASSIVLNLLLNQSKELFQQMKEAEGELLDEEQDEVEEEEEEEDQLLSETEEMISESEDADIVYELHTIKDIAIPEGDNEESSSNNNNRNEEHDELQAAVAALDDDDDDDDGSISMTETPNPKRYHHPLQCLGNHNATHQRTDQQSDDHDDDVNMRGHALAGTGAVDDMSLPSLVSFFDSSFCSNNTGGNNTYGESGTTTLSYASSFSTFHDGSSNSVVSSTSSVTMTLQELFDELDLAEREEDDDEDIFPETGHEKEHLQALPIPPSPPSLAASAITPPIINGRKHLQQQRLTQQQQPRNGPSATAPPPAPHEGPSVATKSILKKKKCDASLYKSLSRLPEEILPEDLPGSMGTPLIGLGSSTHSSSRWDPI
jgi:hypothetical protein